MTDYELELIRQETEKLAMIFKLLHFNLLKNEVEVSSDVVGKLSMHLLLTIQQQQAKLEEVRNMLMKQNPHIPFAPKGQVIEHGESCLLCHNKLAIDKKGYLYCKCWYNQYHKNKEEK